MSTKMHFLVFFNHRHLLIVEMVNYLLETLIIVILFEILLSFSIPRYIFYSFVLFFIII